MNRIKAIIKYIDGSDKVADIGCDHAELSILLAKKAIHSIGIDIRSNIIEKSMDKINKYNFKDYIDLRIGNGTDSLKENEVNTLVLSGLGTHTIVKIISKSIYKFNKIITISNNDHKLLRERMLALGYKIMLEEIIYEKNKYYNLIIFVPGVADYTKKELYIGYNHKNLDLLKKYNSYVHDINIKYYNKNAITKELIDIINNYKY